MSKHLQTGRGGEEMAARFLQQQGYQVVLRNWRYKHLEVDIIARDQGILVFVEVKTRSRADFGMPYESVDAAKELKLSRAANLYMKQIGYEGEIRFDIVSILYSARDDQYNIRIIKDAFWPE